MLFGRINKEIVVVNLESSDEDTEKEPENPTKANPKNAIVVLKRLTAPDKQPTKRPAENDSNQTSRKRQKIPEKQPEIVYNQNKEIEDSEISDEFRIPEDIQLLFPEKQLEDIDSQTIKSVLKPRRKVLKKLTINMCYLIICPSMWKKIGRYSKNITELVISLDSNPYRMTDDDFKNLFEPMINLLALEIKGFDNTFRSWSLRHLPMSQIKKITLMLKQESIRSGLTQYIPQDAFATTTKLKALILKGFELKKPSLEHIEQDRKLKYLSLTYCLFSLNPTISMNFSQHQKLKYLDLSNSKNVSDLFFEEIDKHCPLLNHVNLKNCSTLSNPAIKHLAQLQSLEVLLITGLTKLTDDAIFELKNLKRLDCDECCLISDLGIITLLYKNVDTLESLNVKHCRIHIETLMVANETTKRRKNNVNLNLFVNHTLKEQWKPFKFASSSLFIW